MGTLKGGHEKGLLPNPLVPILLESNTRWSQGPFLEIMVCALCVQFIAAKGTAKQKKENIVQNRIYKGLLSRVNLPPLNPPKKTPNEQQKEQ
jgi:hypothetical protein